MHDGISETLCEQLCCVESAIWTHRLYIPRTIILLNNNGGSGLCMRWRKRERERERDGEGGGQRGALVWSVPKSRHCAPRTLLPTPKLCLKSLRRTPPHDAFVIDVGRVADANEERFG